MQQQTKKPVSTSTVLLAIIFLAIFIVMPPLCRVLYPKEETTGTSDIPPEEETIPPGLTCSKDYSALGYNLMSTSSHQDGNIIANDLMATVIPLSGENATQEENIEFTTLFKSIIDGMDPTTVQKTDTFQEFTLTSANLDFIEKNSNVSAQWKPKEELRAYYEELGFSCTDSDNTVDAEVPTDETSQPVDEVTETPETPVVE